MKRRRRRELRPLMCTNFLCAPDNGRAMGRDGTGAARGETQRRKGTLRASAGKSCLANSLAEQLSSRRTPAASRPLDLSPSSPRFPTLLFPTAGKARAISAPPLRPVESVLPRGLSWPLEKEPLRLASYLHEGSFSTWDCEGPLVSISG
jgi:hypothetical protein